MHQVECSYVPLYASGKQRRRRIGAGDSDHHRLDCICISAACYIWCDPHQRKCLIDAAFLDLYFIAPIYASVGFVHGTGPAGTHQSPSVYSSNNNIYARHRSQPNSIEFIISLNFNFLIASYYSIQIWANSCWTGHPCFQEIRLLVLQQIQIGH